jgi:hypothetical protein
VPGSQITTSVTVINSGLKGYQAISLTNFTASGLSAIAAGSTVEIAGAFFAFNVQESITAFSTITTATTGYIALTPSGTAGSQIVDAAWTATAPTWSESKQGWYASAASSVRVIGGGLKTSGTAMEPKWMLTPAVQNMRADGGLDVPGDLDVGGDISAAGWVETGAGRTIAVSVVDIGDWNMDATASVNVAHGLTFSSIIGAQVWVRTDTNATKFPLDFAQAGDPNGFVSISATTVDLTRIESGIFDSASYDSTSFNRGWIILWYEA